MGIFQSKRRIPEDVYRFWSAVASSLRLGWLGTDDKVKEMKSFQSAIFPFLMNTSAMQGDIGSLECHFQQGANITVSDGHGRTPLHLAAGEGDLETVRFLIKKGADVNLRDSNNETALRDAIRSKSIEVISFLISEGAALEISTVEMGTEMCCLAYLGDSAQMEIWKHAGASLNFADAEGRTPLHVAVCTNQPEMVKFCIRNGSNIELRDHFNNLPIDDARRLGLHAIMEILKLEEKGPHKEAPERAAIRGEQPMSRGLEMFSVVP